MTLKALGQAAGFPEGVADIRISQYESGSRVPKRDLLEKFAAALDVSPKALNVPGLNDSIDVLFTLFTLEDTYGFRICRSGTHLYLLLGDTDASPAELQQMLLAWSDYAQLLKEGKISNDEYDHWRYNLSIPGVVKGTQKYASQKKKKKSF